MYTDMYSKAVISDPNLQISATNSYLGGFGHLPMGRQGKAFRKHGILTAEKRL